MCVTKNQVGSYVQKLFSKIYVWNDGVGMSLRLGLILANIFMVELEPSVIPTLMDKMKC